MFSIPNFLKLRFVSSLIGTIASSTRLFIHHSRDYIEREPIFESKNICEFSLTIENNLKLTITQYTSERFT